MLLNIGINQFDKVIVYNCLTRQLLIIYPKVKCVKDGYKFVYIILKYLLLLK